LNAQKYTQEEHLDAILNYHINDWCKKYDTKLDVREPSSAMATIIKELYEKFNQDEVKYAFCERLMLAYTSYRNDSYGPFMIDEFLESMERGDIDRVLTLIKSLLASIPYDNLPPDKLFLREHNYQTAIYLIFLLMGQYVRCEVHSSHGRSDVEVETKDAIYIFEFKVGGKPIDAITQVKNAGYADKYNASTKSVFLVGATISKNKRTLGKWMVEKIKKATD